MSSRTKIVVLRMKEIIYTAIFIGLGILLITLLFIMFGPGKDTSETASAPAAVYVPGVYSASIVLGSQNVDVEVAVDRELHPVHYIRSFKRFRGNHVSADAAGSRPAGGADLRHAVVRKSDLRGAVAVYVAGAFAGD